MASDCFPAGGKAVLAWFSHKTRKLPRQAHVAIHVIITTAIVVVVIIIINSSNEFNLCN